jgi:prevent-host-death family protein
MDHTGLHYRNEKKTHADLSHRGKAQLTELVRRAEAGDDVVLTRHGHAAVRLVPVKATPDRKSRHSLLEAVRAAGAAKATAGVSAARSQDFLYGNNGLPRCSPSTRPR